MLTNQRSWPVSGQFLCYQYGISVIEAQTSLLQNIPNDEERSEMAVFAGFM